MEAETAPVAEVPVFDAEAEGRALKKGAEAKKLEEAWLKKAELARLAAVANKSEKMLWLLKLELGL
jgi:hypothetical protein